LNIIFGGQRIEVSFHCFPDWKVEALWIHWIWEPRGMRASSRVSSR